MIIKWKRSHALSKSVECDFVKEVIPVFVFVGIAETRLHKADHISLARFKELLKKLKKFIKKKKKNNERSSQKALIKNSWYGEE